MFGLTKTQLDYLTQLFENNNTINEVVIYGSRAKESNTERSDVDLVVTKGNLSLNDLGALISQINESDFPYLVDLTNLDLISNVSLKEHIARVGKTFYQRSTKSL